MAVLASAATKEIVAEREPVHPLHRIRRVAWGYDATGALCIRCSCGEWMRIDPGQIQDQNRFYLHHAEYWVGGDFIRFACGEKATITLKGYAIN